MNIFKDLELFSIQISQPGKNTDKDSNMIFSVWKSGYYTIRTTSFASVDERPSGYSYKLSQEALDRFEKLTKEYVSIFKDAPLDNHVAGIKSVDYTLSIDGKYIVGNFALFPDELMSREDFTARDKKKMKWNNHVVEFYKKVSELGKDMEASHQLTYVQESVKELHYLKPSTRSFIESFKKGIGLTATESKTKDALIKRAIKEAIDADKIPSGKIFADLVSVVKEGTIDMAHNSKSDKEFDVSHGRLCKAILSILGDGYDYIEATRIVDYFFVLSLLVLDEIHTDEQALMLHYPVTPELLLKKYENTTKIEYTFFQKDMRTTVPNAVIVPALSFLNAMRFDRLNESSDQEKPIAQA